MRRVKYDFTNPGQKVILRGRLVLKRDVPLGFEYTERGHVFQTSIRPVRFDLVPVAGVFRNDDTWFGRWSDDPTASPLEPNMPFGYPRTELNDEFRPWHIVKLLEITNRGAVRDLEK